MLDFYVDSMFVIFQDMGGEPLELYRIPTIIKY